VRRVEVLERELRAERPRIDPELARRLDDWAAAGFPRGELGTSPRPLRGAGPAPALKRLRERLGGLPPRRLFTATAAAATLAVVVGVGITQSDLFDGSSRQLSAPSAAEEGTGAEALGAGRTPPPPADSATASESAKAETFAPARDSSLPAPPPAADLPIPDSGAAGIARAEDDRKQDVSARLSLGADADEVQDVANGVVEVTDRYDGVVLNSQVTSDQAGARATFELEIPAAKLDPSIADLSQLGDVISRTEAAEDITAKFVRAKKNLAQTFEQIRKLRTQLIEADTRDERLVIRSQIDSLQARADAFRAQRNDVSREARFASLAVDVTSNGPSGADGGDWGLDDAIDDAGDVLTTLAGIALVSLAILVPLAVVVAISYAIVTAARRRSRERTLDG
jgi:hypothetical protein